MSLLTRRKFLIASGATAATAGIIGGPRYTFASPDDANAGDTVIVLHLRGGCDGQMVLGRQGDNTYQNFRGNTAITNGTEVPQGGGSMAGFFLSPAAAPIASADMMALTAYFPTAGVLDSTLRSIRSHENAQEYMANGNGVRGGTGWLGRMVEAQGGAKKGVINKGNGEYVAGTATVSIDDLESVTENAYVGFNDEAQAPIAIKGLNNGADSLSQTGSALVDSNLQLADLDVSLLRAGYPNGGLGAAFAEAATVAAANLPVSAIQIDNGGWDHHSNINGNFPDKFNEVSECLAQFAEDTNGMEEITLLVTTDFGRTMRRNGGGGSDHGRAFTGIVMGGKVNGGVYGGDPYPLNDDVNGFSNAMPVLTDIRDIYTEVMTQAVDIPNAGALFNNFTPAPAMGFVTA